MNAPRIGSLFSGYGGLDEGVMAALGGGEVMWHVEFAEAPSKILAHHFPGVPNYGDITFVDWASVAPIDVLTGGFPCQDVSLAGRRAGLTDGTRSGLWSEYARAIDVLRPGLVVIENVRGLLSAEAAGAVEPDPWGVGDGATRPTLNAFGVVLGDLAGLGYDARWVGLRAADAGAPHGRFRVFVIATPQHTDSGGRWSSRLTRMGGKVGGRRRGADDSTAAPHPDSDVPDAARDRQRDDWRLPVRGVQAVVGAVDSSKSAAADPDHIVGDGSRRARDGWTKPADGVAPYTDRGQCDRWERETEWNPERGAPASRSSDVAGTEWGPYSTAIERWERVTGRVAPVPTDPDGRNESHRLSARFVEWLMGLEPGRVTDPAIGLSRNDQLKALGNGVVPQQAALAVGWLLEREMAA